MADRIDSRDLVKELEELSTQDEPFMLGEYDRYEALKEVIKELRENCDEEPENGIQLIPVDDFTEYAKEYADGCGYLQLKAFNINEASYSGMPTTTIEVVDQWPFKHIDWDAAAEELKEDWFEVEFDGTTYLAR